MSTAGPVETVVLALGNTLLRDDGVGVVILDALRAQAPARVPARQTQVSAPQFCLQGGVEFVDGGTQGLALLGVLSGRRTAVILDAVALGAAPGTVHVLSADDAVRMRSHRSTTAHEGNAGELLATARLLGDLPQRTIIIGIEPEEVRTGVGLSDAVARSVPEAVACARRVLEGSFTYVPGHSG
ncbi:MAG: hydrogenase maturation protease [Bryobacteraceae bacterium]|jgi:hydrogenase maturation protease